MQTSPGSPDQDGGREVSLSCVTPWSHPDEEWRCSIPGCGCGGVESLHGCQGSPTGSVGIVAELGSSRRSISATSKLLLEKRSHPSPAPSRTVGQPGLCWAPPAHSWRLCQGEQPIPSSPLDPGICHCHAKGWIWDVIHTSSPSLIHCHKPAGNTRSAGSGCGS